jgi:hypothetical protein
MPDRTIADDRLALNHLCKDVDLFIGECDSDVFAYHSRVSTDRDDLSVAVHANRDVAADAQDTFRAFDRNTNVTTPAEHRHLKKERSER